MHTLVVSLGVAIGTILGPSGQPVDVFPVLVGRDTPVGVFRAHHVTTDQPGYGGDVLAFDEVGGVVYAVHRPYWQSAMRIEMLQESAAIDRTAVTGGCINVSNAVYERWATKISIVEIVK